MLGIDFSKIITVSFGKHSSDMEIVERNDILTIFDRKRDIPLFRFEKRTDSFILFTYCHDWTLSDDDNMIFFMNFIIRFVNHCEKKMIDICIDSSDMPLSIYRSISRMFATYKENGDTYPFTSFNTLSSNYDIHIKNTVIHLVYLKSREENEDYDYDKNRFVLDVGYLYRSFEQWKKYICEDESEDSVRFSYQNNDSEKFFHFFTISKGYNKKENVLLVEIYNDVIDLNDDTFCVCMDTLFLRILELNSPDKFILVFHNLPFELYRRWKHFYDDNCERIKDKYELAWSEGDRYLEFMSWDNKIVDDDFGYESQF